MVVLTFGIVEEQLLVELMLNQAILQLLIVVVTNADVREHLDHCYCL